MASPTIDGHAHGTANGATAPKATLTTVNAGDTIGVFVYASTNTSNPSPTAKVTGVSSTHTTGWAQRGLIEQVNVGGTGWSLSYWTGTAAAALTAEVITATLGHSTDACAIVAFGIHGAVGFDPATLPVTGISSTSSTHPTFSLTTTKPDDMLVCCIGVTNFGTVLTNPPTGWSLLDNVTNNGGGLGCEIGAGNLSVSATQTGVSVQWGSGPGQLNNNDRIPFIIDAFTADAASSAQQQLAVTIVS